MPSTGTYGPVKVVLAALLIATVVLTWAGGLWALLVGVALFLLIVTVAAVSEHSSKRGERG